MPFHGLGLGLCVGAAVLLGTATSSANVVTLETGPDVEGHVDVDLDEYGSYGLIVTPPADDNFWPLGAPRKIAQTYIASSYLFIKQPIQAAVALSSHSKIIQKTPTGNGLEGGNGLATTITMPNVNNAGTVHGEFSVTNATPALSIAVALDQKLAAGATATITRLEQDYTIRNTSTVAVTLVFHTFWDMNLTHIGPSGDDDVVGTGPGTCYVYQHEPNNPAMGGSLADGGSTVMTRYHFAAKDGYAPNGGPAYTFGASTVQPVWTALGMPTEWRNNIAYLGAGPGATATSGDAYLAMEWHFTLAPNEQHTIKVRRIYGTSTVPCNVSVSCGNGITDPPNETCDEPMDTLMCDKDACNAPACNDGYFNPVAEDCESNGIDSMECIGATCKKSICGDGYVNEAALETCDDPNDPTCIDCGIVDPDKLTIGGGCAGCTSGGNATWLFAIVIALAARGTRRRVPLRVSRRNAP